MTRINSLDGLRALSIMMVLLAHAAPTMPAALTSSILFQLLANSHLGVKIFFVISGYLITKLLILEKEKNGVISIKQFYLRRIFRIFPIFYIYILTLIILKSTIAPSILSSYQDVLPAAFYLWNYKQFFMSTNGNSNWFLGHFWSLSMEEQFYLLWPFVFVFFYAGSRGSKLTTILLTMIVLMPVVRVATYLWMPGNRGQIGMMLQTGGDTILMGCYGAVIERKASFKEKYLKYLKGNSLVIFAIVFLLVISPLLSNHFKGAYALPIGMSLENILILIFILFSIYVPTTYQRVLQHKILVQIGMLSYSLYVWQQLFLSNLYTSWVNRFPQNLFIVFAVGYISYFLIEKPIMQLRSRFNTVPLQDSAKQSEVAATYISACSKLNS